MDEQFKKRIYKYIIRLIKSKFWLNVLIDSELISSGLKDECNWILNETSEFAKIFASSILTMKKKS